MTPYQIQVVQCTRAESRNPSRQSPRKEEEERLRASLGRV
jgi:hypothetical protein